MNIHPETLTDNGRTYVRLPADEFAELMRRLEEAEDMHDGRKALARVGYGEETFPAELVKQLLGANAGKRLSIWRKYRGLTRNALAKAVDVSGSAVTMIETGKRNASIEVYKALAETLRCDIESLI